MLSSHEILDFLKFFNYDSFYPNKYIINGRYTYLTMASSSVVQGSPIPKTKSHILHYICSKSGEPYTLDTNTLIRGTYVIVGVPAAFSPPCSELHLPSYIRSLGKFSENDAHVLVINTDNIFANRAWAESFKVADKQDKIRFVSDLNAGYLKSLRLTTEQAPFLGEISGRFVIVLKDGIVDYFGKEDVISKVDRSAAEDVLEHSFKD